jgi:hypothetical protein
MCIVAGGTGPGFPLCGKSGRVRESQGIQKLLESQGKSGNFSLAGTNFSTVVLVVVNGGLTAIGINKSMMQYVRGSHGRYKEAWF